MFSEHPRWIARASRKVSRFLTVCLGLSCFTPSLLAEPLYFFGDSLTDSGSPIVALYTTGLPYSGTTFSDGPTWASVVDTQQAIWGVNNFAVGGAVSADLITTDDPNGVARILGVSQVGQYLYGPQNPAFGQADPAGRHIIWLGGNDLRNDYTLQLSTLGGYTADPTSIELIQANIGAGIDSLKAAGAQRFIINGMVNYSVSPEVLDADKDAMLGFVMSYNADLAYAADAEYFGEDIKLFDPIAPLLLLSEQWLDAEGNRGLEPGETAAVCLRDPTCFVTAPNGDSSDFLLFDDIHPSKSVHVDVANAFAELLAAPTRSTCAASIDVAADGCLVEQTGVAQTVTIEPTGSVTNILGTGAAILVDDEDEGPVALVNEGAITSTGVLGYAAGVRYNNDMVGGLTNGGTITAGDNDYATQVFGIYINEDIYEGAELNNSGTITATASQDYRTFDARAVAIYIGDDLYGTVTNSGRIEALLLGDEDSTLWGAYAAALVINGGDGDGSVLNSGTIIGDIYIDDSGRFENTATGDISSDDVYIGTAAFVNAGSISTQYFESDYEWDEESVDDVPDNGSFENSGVISSSEYFDVDAGSFTNAGNIQSEYISLGTDVFDNSGTIAADEIVIENYDEGLTDVVYQNSGAIDGSVVIDHYDFAFGAQGEEIPDSTTFTNSGEISGSLRFNPGTTNTVLNLGGGSIRGGVSSLDPVVVNVTGPVQSSLNNLDAAQVWEFNVKSGGEWIQDTASLQLPYFLVNVERGGRFRFSEQADLGLDFDNAGTVSVAAGVAATITGTYMQPEGGVFETQIDGEAVGHLTVAGTADLSESAAVHVDVLELLDPTETFSGVLVADALTVGDGGITTTSNLTYYNPIAVKNGNAIDISFERGLMLEDVAETGGTSTTTGIANTLDAVIDEGPAAADDPLGQDLEDVLVEMGSLDGNDAINGAMEQMTPALTGGLAVASQANAGRVATIVTQRLSAGRGLAAGDDGAYEDHIWIKPFGAYIEQDRRQGTPGYEIESYGVSIGNDVQLSDRLMLGLGFAWSDSDVDGKTISRNDVDVETYQVFAYGNYDTGSDTFFEGSAAFGWNDNEAVRDVNFGNVRRSARADFDSFFANVYAGFGKEYQRNEQVSFTPVMTLRYTHYDQDSYRESGAGALNLAVRSEDTDMLILGLDGVSRLRFGADNAYELSVRGGFGFDVIADRAIATSTLSGGGTAFATRGAKPDDFVYRAGIGLKAEPGERFSMRADYEFEGREDYQSHGASLNLRWQFY